MHRADPERGTLKRWPTVDITSSIRYQVRAQVDKVKYHYITSARDHIAEHFDLHPFESNGEHLEFIDSFLADNKYLFPVAEHVEGGVHGRNPTQKVSKAANDWPASTLLAGGSNPVFIYIKFYHRVNNCGNSADGFYNSMIDDRDSDIPSPLIMFTCTALCHALLEWKMN